MIRNVIGMSALLAFSVPVHAQTDSVYPGCSVPASVAGHRTFYVDPVNGNDSGDGTVSRPWQTLASVIAAGKVSSLGHQAAGGTDALKPTNPKGPVKAGDVILLKSGNHGEVKILNAFNSDFVTVMAAPGETPVISSLNISSAAKWAFRGIKFQSADSPVATEVSKRAFLSLVWASGSDYFGKSSDLIFDNDSFSTTDDTTSWSDNDWLVRPKYYGISIKASCVSVANSSLYNLLNGITIASKQVNISNNTIHHFSNDGIDFSAGEVIIKSNVIRDGTSVKSSPWHADGIQGWSVTSNGVTVLNNNVTIDSNLILKHGDSVQSPMQGISIFSGRWNNVTISNNAVVSNVWHAIALSGASNSKIVNNTVLASDPLKHPSWIAVNGSPEAGPPTNVVVRNNISSSLMIIAATGVTYDHNTVAGLYAIMSAGKLVYFKTSDTSKGVTVVPSLESQFVTVNNTLGSYDLRLKDASSLRGMASTSLLPPLDILGIARTAPFSPGAYAN